MISIELKDVHIHAFHGLYEGEEKVGNPYIVNLSVRYDEANSDFESINGTINYVELFEIVNTRMHVPTALLEKICESIIRHIRHQYPFVSEIDLSIHKLQAPINNFQGKVGVSMNKKFDD
jgi:7,8-dihydroneopterin aldolase/epimerase/oxygenase